jgi:integrase
MASFRKRSGRWQARVTRKGQPDLAKTFDAKEDAQKWARAIEREIDTGSFMPSQYASGQTLRELIDRYRKEVVPKLRGASTELFRLRTIERHLGHLSVAALTAAAIAGYRDRRLEMVTASTCLRELQSLSAMLALAHREWQVIANNPVQSIRKPSPNRPRERRLSQGDEARLLAELTPSERLSDGKWPRGVRNFWIKPLVQLALETAMRRGELLALRWEYIDLIKRTAYLPVTKNGLSRTVPLSTAAVKVLEALPRAIDGRVFPVTPNAVKQAWDRARARAGLSDLHLHDLRHESTSRLAERLNVLELAAITGHRDLRMLQRYTHLSPESLASKIG